MSEYQNKHSTRKKSARSEEKITRGRIISTNVKQPAEILKKQYWESLLKKKEEEIHMFPY